MDTYLQNKNTANCNHIHIRCAENKFHTICAKYHFSKLLKAVLPGKVLWAFLWWWCFGLGYCTNLRSEAKSIPVAWGSRDRKQNLICMLVINIFRVNKFNLNWMKAKKTFMTFHFHESFLLLFLSGWTTV